jgi:YVTN family beta-propeller protein
VASTITVGGSPYRVAVTPDGSRVYVTINGVPAGWVSVIDTATNTVLGSIPVGNNPFGVAVTPDGSRVFVTNFGGGSVTVIDTATNTVVGSEIPVGAHPDGVAVTPDGSRVFVTNNDTPGSVTVVAIQPPSAPGSVTATAGDAQMAVAWAAAGFTGGQPITGYTATAAPGGRTCTTSGATTCTITGLTNGTAYTVTVWATNRIGTSGPSKPSNPVTPTAPTPPPQPTITTPPAATAPSAPPVVVKVKARSGKSKLFVDVNPNKGSGYWRFQVQKKRADGTWKLLKTYRTKGATETRTINLPKGTFQVMVRAKYGFAGTTSTAVTLKR